MKLVPILLSLSLVVGCEGNNKRLTQDSPASPINLSHALSLVDSMEINGEVITYIRVYANAPSYEPVPAVGEGIACVDDVGRFMEVLETEILVYHKSELIPIAAGMTRFLLYLSRADGLWYNFMLADGSINTTHENSTAEFGWWAIRGLRGLAAAYNIFANNTQYAQLLSEITTRIQATESHILAALQSYPAKELTSWGLRPTWLVNNAPDMSSELLLALTKLQNTGRFDYLEAIQKIAEGLMGYQHRLSEHELDGLYFCWNNTWHNWGNNQAYGLLEAYKINQDSTILASVESWADTFVPYLIQNGFPFEITVSSNEHFTVTEWPQIAYGMNSIYRGLKTLALIENSGHYQQLSEEVFQWFKGVNPAQTPMYDPSTGRGYDGINGPGSVNYNSGAESTIECLLAIQMRGAL